MNPVTVAPEAVLLIFILVVAAAFAGSMTLMTFAAVCCAALFYYVRGPQSYDDAGKPNDLIAPCDGIVQNIYCDIQRFTHIKVDHQITDRHGVYTMCVCEIHSIEQQDDGDMTTKTHIQMNADAGRIEMIIRTPKYFSPRSFVSVGDHLERGTAMCFVPLYASIEIILPVYQSALQLKQYDPMTAGHIIGDVLMVFG
jgi:hypothetical protein